MGVTNKWHLQDEWLLWLFNFGLSIAMYQNPFMRVCSERAFEKLNIY